MTTEQSDKTTHGLIQCGTDSSRREGVTLSVAAKRRLTDKSGPVKCPVCRTVCGASFIEASPSGEGMILVHFDDDNGGKWERQMAWTVSFPKG